MIHLMPDTVTAVRAYLLTVLTAEVGTRIYYGALPKDPTFPAVRITDISTTDASPGWSRSLLQIDVWHSDGRLRDCRALAELVRAALIDSTNYRTDAWVLGGVDNVNGATTQPFATGLDTSFTPPRPRYLVTAGLLIRPN